MTVGKWWRICAKVFKRFTVQKRWCICIFRNRAVLGTGWYGKEIKHSNNTTDAEILNPPPCSNRKKASFTLHISLLARDSTIARVSSCSGLYCFQVCNTLTCTFQPFLKGLISFKEVTCIIADILAIFERVVMIRCEKTWTQLGCLYSSRLVESFFYRV